MVDSAEPVKAKSWGKRARRFVGPPASLDFLCRIPYAPRPKEREQSPFCRDRQEMAGLSHLGEKEIVG